MAKTLFKAGLQNRSTLVILGWLTFFWSFFTTQTLWTIFLQGVARVLP